MPLADHSIARLGHLDPRAGEITDGLRDHEPRVIGHLPQNLPFGIQLPEHADVAVEEQRSRLALGGVAERPHALAVGGRDRALERVRDAFLPAAGLDEPRWRGAGRRAGRGAGRRGGGSAGRRAGPGRTRRGAGQTARGGGCVPAWPDASIYAAADRRMTMDLDTASHDHPGTERVSTGVLPPDTDVQALVTAGDERFRDLDEGAVADYIPALAAASPSAFGVCVAGVRGRLFRSATLTRSSRSRVSPSSLSSPWSVTRWGRGGAPETGR